jgi:hypothetical protein
MFSFITDAIFGPVSGVIELKFRRVGECDSCGKTESLNFEGPEPGNTSESLLCYECMESALTTQ